MFQTNLLIVDQNLQLTDYRDKSTKLGFSVGTRSERQQKQFKNADI